MSFLLDQFGALSAPVINVTPCDTLLSGRFHDSLWQQEVCLCHVLIT